MALAALFIAGCKSVSSYSYESVYGRVKYPRGSEICFIDSSKRLLPRFKDAFTKAGFTVVEPTRECTAAVTVELVSWTYDIDGLTLYGDQHDDVEIAVMVRDPETMRIHSRASVFVHDDFTIIEKFARSLLDEEEQ